MIRFPRIRPWLAAALALPGANGIALAQPPQTDHAVRMATVERIESTTRGVSAIRDRAARVAALTALCRPELFAPPLAPTSDEGWYELGQVAAWAGARLTKEDADDIALDSLTALAESAAPVFHREQAWRLAGQVHMKHRRWAQAAACFERQIALCDANPSLQVVGGCASGLNQLAVARRMPGQSAEAVAALDKVIESRGVAAEPDSVGRALRMKAATLADAGQPDAALAAIAAFLDANPAWGEADGERLAAIALKARMLLRLNRAEEALAATAAAWPAAAASTHHHALALGREHAAALIAARRIPEAMDTRSAMIDLIDRNEAAWSASRSAASLNDQRLSLLSQLLEADRFQRPRLAEAAADRLLASIPDPAILADLEKVRARARRASGRE